LAVLEEEEEEDPEDTHNVPVPDGGIDEDLTSGERAGELEEQESCDEADDSQEQMDGMGNGDEVEEMAAGIGAEEDLLRGELIPGGPLASEEEASEKKREREPEGGALRDGTSYAEPLIHGILFTEHGLTGDLGGNGTEKEDGGIEPEDGGNGGGEPLVDEVAIGVEVAAGFGDEEDADQGDEEHEVAAEGEEETDACPGEALARAAMALGAIVEVVPIAFAVATRALICRRLLAVVAITDVVMAVNLWRCEGGWHIAG